MLANRALGVDLEPLRNALVVVEVVADGQVGHEGLLVHHLVANDAGPRVHKILRVFDVSSVHIPPPLLRNVALVDALDPPEVSVDVPKSNCPVTRGACMLANSKGMRWAVEGGRVT